MQAEKRDLEKKEENRNSAKKAKGTTETAGPSAQMNDLTEVDAMGGKKFTV